MSFAVYLFDLASWSAPFWSLAEGQLPREITFNAAGMGHRLVIAADLLSDEIPARLAAPIETGGRSHPAGEAALVLEGGLVLRDAATGYSHFAALLLLDGQPLGTVLSRGWAADAPEDGAADLGRSDTLGSEDDPARDGAGETVSDTGPDMGPDMGEDGASTGAQPLSCWHEAPAAGARFSVQAVTAASPAGNPFRNDGAHGAAFAAQDFLPFGRGLRLEARSPLLTAPRQLPYLAAGNLVLTGRGPVPIEQLEVGDLVLTADHGYRPLRWIGRRQLSAADLAREPELRPIRIAAQALGPAQPAEALLVSPEHRMLIRSALIHEIFEVREALVAARHLTAFAGVTRARDLTEVVYYQLAFDSHEVIFANGALTETLQCGRETLAALAPADLAELAARLPSLPPQLGATRGGARMTLSAAQSRVLAQYQSESDSGLLTA